MTCAEVRERLSDHVLGSLPSSEERRVRRHLRGCGTCRAELRALEDGLAVAAATVAPVEPPPALREQVLGALEEEWLEAPAASRPGGAWLVAVAAAVVVLLALVWGVGQARRAERAAAEAASYERVLATLGGTGFRVGEVHPVGASGVRGSVLVYRSAWGRSWAAVFLRIPEELGHDEIRASLTGPGGLSVAFEALWDEDGEAWGWLTTDLEVEGIDRVWIRAGDGTLLAAGGITRA